MSLLSLDEIKRHLRIFESDEDTDIGDYRDAAERYVSEYLDRRVYSTSVKIPAEDSYGIHLNSAIIAAIKLVTAHLFEHRESVSVDKSYQVPMAVESLLARHRVWRPDCEELMNSIFVYVEESNDIELQWTSDEGSPQDLTGHTLGATIKFFDGTPDFDAGSGLSVTDAALGKFSMSFAPGFAGIKEGYEQTITITATSGSTISGVLRNFPVTGR